MITRYTEYCGQGASYTEIGKTEGISIQAAHQNMKKIGLVDLHNGIVNTNGKIIKKITDLKTIINEYIKGEGTLVELVKEKMKNAEKLKTLRWIKNTLTPDLKTKRNYLIQLENSL